MFHTWSSNLSFNYTIKLILVFIKAIALCHSSELAYLKQLWCTFDPISLFSFPDFKIIFISFHFTWARCQVLTSWHHYKLNIELRCKVYFLVESSHDKDCHINWSRLTALLKYSSTRDFHFSTWRFSHWSTNYKHVRLTHTKLWLSRLVIMVLQWYA